LNCCCSPISPWNWYSSGNTSVCFPVSPPIPEPIGWLPTVCLSTENFSCCVITFSWVLFHILLYFHFGWLTHLPLPWQHFFSPHLHTLHPQRTVALHMSEISPRV